MPSPVCGYSGYLFKIIESWVADVPPRGWQAFLRLCRPFEILQNYIREGTFGAYRESTITTSFPDAPFGA